MNIQDILTLYEYNYWASSKILAASEKVTPEQYVAHAAHSYGSLRGTLVHTFDVEQSWRMMCQHGAFTPDVKEADVPNFDGLQARWREEERRMRDYLAALRDADMTTVVRYTADNGAKRARLLWHCLWHVVNHGTQHRAEAAAILTGYDSSPGDVDFTVFLNEKGITAPT